MSKRYNIITGKNNEASEVEGRLRTQRLRYIKNMFKVNDEVKLKVVNDSKANPTRIVEGKVIQKNDALIVIKTSRDIESFNYSEFFTHRVRVISN